MLPALPRHHPCCLVRFSSPFGSQPRGLPCQEALPERHAWSGTSPPTRGKKLNHGVGFWKPNCLRMAGPTTRSGLPSVPPPTPLSPRMSHPYHSLPPYYWFVWTSVSTRSLPLLAGIPKSARAPWPAPCPKPVRGIGLPACPSSRTPPYWLQDFAGSGCDWL